MKKILLLISSMLSLSASSQTFVYHPFPDSAASWNIEAHWPCGFGFDTWQYLYSYTLAGDTTIASNLYHKLQVPVKVIVSHGGCTQPGTWTTPGYYAGAIRQDTAARKVFFIESGATTEELLYDFNMVVGDTVKGYTERTNPEIDTIESIDSVLVGSDYRKRWTVNVCYQISFIEGVGSTFGLLENSPGCITDGGTALVTCFKQNGNTLFPNTATNCDLISGVNAISQENHSLIISPNPFHTSAFVSVTSLFEDADMKIYDVLGMLVHREKLESLTSFPLKRDKLSNGIYFLQITTEKGQSATLKFIVD